MNRKLLRPSGLTGLEGWPRFAYMLQVNPPRPFLDGPMMSTPTPQQASRWNHFVTKSWQCRFSFNGTRVWSYEADRFRDVQPDSPGSIMATRDLYVIDPAGAIDDGYEKILFQPIDNACKKYFDQLERGDRSADLKGELSYIIAIQLVRTPSARRLIADRVKHMLDHTLCVFDFIDYASYSKSDEVFLNERMFDAVRAVHGSKERLRRQLDAAPDSLGSDHPALPWIALATDLETIRPIADALEKMHWEVAVTNEPAFVLGDAGVAHAPGMTWETGVRVPISSRMALWIEPADCPSSGVEPMTLHEGAAMAVNYWSAAQAERWVIAETEDLLQRAVDQRRSRLA